MTGASVLNYEFSIRKILIHFDFKFRVLEHLFWLSMVQKTLKQSSQFTRTTQKGDKMTVMDMVQFKYMSGLNNNKSEENNLETTK